MRPLYFQRYLLTGLLTFLPIWLTWIVFKSIFSLLSQLNLPWISALFEAFPTTLGRLHESGLVSALAFVVPRAECSASACSARSSASSSTSRSRTASTVAQRS